MRGRYRWGERVGASFVAGDVGECEEINDGNYGCLDTYGSNHKGSL